MSSVTGALHGAILRAVPRPVGDGEVLDVTGPGPYGEDASLDTIVCTLVLCSVPDPLGALKDMRRVLRPGGQLLFLEHVLASTGVGRLQRLAAPAWAALAGGCRLDRDTIGAMRAAGFVVTDCDRPKPLGRASAQTVVVGRAIPRQS